MTYPRTTKPHKDRKEEIDCILCNGSGDRPKKDGGKRPCAGCKGTGKIRNYLHDVVQE